MHLEAFVKSYAKIVINRPRTYEKLICKGEPYRFAGYRDPSVKTDTRKQTIFSMAIWLVSPMMIHKITPSIEYNLWLKLLDNQLNEPTYQNSLKASKVVKPTNNKRLL